MTSVGDQVKISNVRGSKIATGVTAGSVGDTLHISTIHGTRVGTPVVSPSLNDDVLVRAIRGRLVAIVNLIGLGLTEGIFAHSCVVDASGNLLTLGGAEGYTVPAINIERSSNGGGSWSNLVSSPPWYPRAYTGCAVLPNGTIIVAGGTGFNIYPGFTSSTMYNDVWKSSDEGITWTRQTAAAGWAARCGHSLVALSNGNLVLMGGYSNGGWYYHNDVWISSDEGATWTQQTAAAGWAARIWHSCAVLPGNAIILSGGNSTFNLQSTPYHDVWISSDEGITWTRQTAAAGWAARERHNTVVTSDGTIVLMGGNIGGASLSNQLGVAATDVWISSDEGVTWTQQTAAAGWDTYASATAILSSDKIVFTGGVKYSTTDGYEIVVNTAWASNNKGASWSKISG